MGPDPTVAASMQRALRDGRDLRGSRDRRDAAWVSTTTGTAREDWWDSHHVAWNEAPTDLGGAGRDSVGSQGSQEGLPAAEHLRIRSWDRSDWSDSSPSCSGTGRRVWHVGLTTAHLRQSIGGAGRDSSDWSGSSPSWQDSLPFSGQTRVAPIKGELGKNPSCVHGAALLFTTAAGSYETWVAAGNAKAPSTMDEVMQVITAAERSTQALSDCTTRFPNTAMAFKMIQSAKGMMELEYHNRGSGYFRVHCWSCKQATEPHLLQRE